MLLDMTNPKNAGMLRKMGPKGVYAQVVENDENGNKKYKNLDKLADMIKPQYVPGSQG